MPATRNFIIENIDEYLKYGWVSMKKILLQNKAVEYLSILEHIYATE